MPLACYGCRPQLFLVPPVPSIVTGGMTFKLDELSSLKFPRTPPARLDQVPWKRPTIRCLTDIHSLLQTTLVLEVWNCLVEPTNEPRFLGGVQHWLRTIIQAASPGREVLELYSAVLLLVRQSYRIRVTNADGNGATAFCQGYDQHISIGARPDRMLSFWFEDVICALLAWQLCMAALSSH